MMGNFTVT